MRWFVARLGVTASGQGLAFIAGLGNQILLTRSLGVAGYGQYALVVASASLLAWWVGLGLQVATPAWIRGDPLRARTVLGMAGSYLLALAVILGAGFVLFPEIPSRAMSATMDVAVGRWLLPTSVTSLTLLIMLSAVLGMSLYPAHGGVSVANSLAALLLNTRLLGLPESARVENALLNVNLAYAVAGGLATALILWRTGVGRGVGWRALLAERSAATARIYVGNMVRLVLLRTPFYVTDRLLGPIALGIYGLADYLANLLLRPVGIAGQVLLASVSADPDRAGSAVATWLGRAMSTLTVAGGVVLVLIGGGGLEFLFGTDFGASHRVLMVLIPGVWAYAVFTVIDNYYVAHGYPWRMVGAFVGGAAGTLAVSVPGGVYAGLRGIGVGYSAGLVVLLLVAGWAFVRDCGVRWRDLLLPTGGDWRTVRGLVARRFGGTT